MKQYRQENFQGIDFERVWTRQHLNQIEFRRSKRSAHQKQKRLDLLRSQSPEFPPSILKIHPMLGSYPPSEILKQLTGLLEEPQEDPLLSDVFGLLHFYILRTQLPVSSYQESHLVEILLGHCHTKSPMMEKACEVFCNITSRSSEYNQLVIQSGAVPILVKLINDSNIDDCESPIWILANLAEDNVDKESMIELGITKLLLSKVPSDFLVKRRLFAYVRPLQTKIAKSI